MSVPSVSVGLHDRYTPEIRDRIVEKLQAPIDDTAYHLLTPAHLRTLAATESPDAPVLSFYLQLGPERRSRGGWHSVFSSLANETLQGDPRPARARVVRDELDRIEERSERAAARAGPRGGVLHLPDDRPVAADRGVGALARWCALGRRPYVRPLVRTRDEHDRFVLALLSQEHSRFFISQIGQVEEVFQVNGQRVPRVHEEPRRAIAVISGCRSRSGARAACWPRSPGW